MAGIVGIYASIGEHVPWITKREKYTEAQSESWVNRCHYRATTLLILVFTLAVTSTEWIAGTESIIDCLHHGAIPENVINNYCYISGTFTVPKHYVYYEAHIGYNISQTGVGPYDPRDARDIEVKAYYQWVPFMLFLQSIMFYIPHVIYKSFEGGKIKTILGGLHNWILRTDDREGAQDELAKYIVETKGSHVSWAYSVMLAQFLYLVNVVGQIFFTDCFLGWEFTKYGVRALSFIEADPRSRIDPMSRVFPRVTKCTFRKYGPSGTIQRHDAQCVLPINIINEKIYVFLWIWFALLTVLTAIHVIWTMVIVFARGVRKTILKRKINKSPNRNHLDIDIDLIVKNFNFGDWKLLYHLLSNMDNITFGEFMEALTKHMKKSENGSRKSGDNISLTSLLKPDPPEKSAPPEDSEELLDNLGKSDYPRLGKVGRPDKASAPPKAPTPSPRQGRRNRYPFSPKAKFF